jgi:hypothetical protein
VRDKSKRKKSHNKRRRQEREVHQAKSYMPLPHAKYRVFVVKTKAVLVAVVGLKLNDCKVISKKGRSLDHLDKMTLGVILNLNKTGNNPFHLIPTGSVPAIELLVK